MKKKSRKGLLRQLAFRRCRATAPTNEENCKKGWGRVQYARAQLFLCRCAHKSVRYIAIQFTTRKLFLFDDAMANFSRH
jgi:hypothetical protein